jgi:hypothetical protein
MGQRTITFIFDSAVLPTVFVFQLLAIQLLSQPSIANQEFLIMGIIMAGALAILTAFLLKPL